MFKFFLFVFVMSISGIKLCIIIYAYNLDKLYVNLQALWLFQMWYWKEKVRDERGTRDYFNVKCTSNSSCFWSRGFISFVFVTFFSHIFLLLPVQPFIYLLKKFCILESKIKFHPKYCIEFEIMWIMDWYKNTYKKYFNSHFF